MIQGIIDDSKALEAEAIRSEESAQATFEEFSKDTAEAIEEKTKDVVHKSQEKAKAEKDKINSEVERDTTLSEIEELAQVEADLHKSCDVFSSPHNCTTQSANMLAFLHVSLSPNLKFVAAKLSIIVAGHNALPVILHPSPSAAAPKATIDIPHLDM